MPCLPFRVSTNLHILCTYTYILVSLKNHVIVWSVGFCLQYRSPRWRTMFVTPFVLLVPISQILGGVDCCWYVSRKIPKCKMVCKSALAEDSAVTLNLIYHFAYHHINNNNSSKLGIWIHAYKEDRLFSNMGPDKPLIDNSAMAHGMYLLLCMCNIASRYKHYRVDITWQIMKTRTKLSSPSLHYSSSPVHCLYIPIQSVHNCMTVWS